MNLPLMIALALAVAACAAAIGVAVSWLFLPHAYERGYQFGYRAGVRRHTEPPPAIRRFRLPRRTR